MWNDLVHIWPYNLFLGMIIFFLKIKNNTYQNKSVENHINTLFI